MEKGMRFLILVLLPLFCVRAPLQQEQRAVEEPEWAFPVTSENPPPAEDPATIKRIPGSTKTYTVKEIDDLFRPPDWFPNQHSPAPRIVTHGDGHRVPACGSCHLMSGLGHPQSANLTGLSVGYLEKQLNYFKDGNRKDAFQMTAIGMALSDEDRRLASAWFASLKPRVWVRVVETAMVPRSYVKRPHMRLPLPNGGKEPIGVRIVELPENPLLAVNRDPNSGFVAYVPIGSVLRGEALVKTGGNGKTVPCSTCHGPSLAGVGDVPRIAGVSPEYLGRQLYRFKGGTRAAPPDALMKPVVARLTAKDIVDISAYLASRTPLP
jgi:cytochrome c553